MRVTIKQTNDRGFCLKLPTGLALNRPVAWVLARKLRKQDVYISSKDLYRFMKAVRCYKKAHPDWLLAEVNSADGERISVML